jgi:hypothetical protein
MEHLREALFMVGSWPYLQILKWAGKACQGQTLRCKKIYNFGPRLRPEGLSTEVSIWSLGNVWVGRMGSSLNFVFDKLHVEKVTLSKNYCMIFAFFKKYFSWIAFDKLHLMCKWLCVLADVLITNARLRLQILVMSLYSGTFNYFLLYWPSITCQ